jgi:hypothetical protein
VKGGEEDGQSTAANGPKKAAKAAIQPVAEEEASE